MERSLEFLRLLTKLQKTLNDRDEFRREAKLPFLVNHARTITKRAINNMDKNELLIKCIQSEDEKLKDASSKKKFTLLVRH